MSQAAIHSSILRAGAAARTELALTYFAVAVLTMLAGPGVLSLDYLLFGRGSRVAPTDETTRRASVPTV